MTAGSHTTALSLVHASDEVDGVVVLTLSHPPANTLSDALVSELRAKLVTLATGPNAPAPPTHHPLTGGDHVILIGRVHDARTGADKPVTWYRGGFLPLGERAA